VIGLLGRLWWQNHEGKCILLLVSCLNCMKSVKCSVVGGAKHTPNTKGQWNKQVQCHILKLLVGFNLTNYFKTKLPVGHVEHTKPSITTCIPETFCIGNSILKHASCGKPRQYTEGIACILYVKPRHIRMRVPRHLAGLPCKFEGLCVQNWHKKAYWT
jgi:hypothetical protein